METCRTCKFASIMQQQCRAESPKAFLAMSSKGPVPVTCFPSLPEDGTGCGAHRMAEDEEIARREVEHPVTVREAPDRPRLVTP